MSIDAMIQLLELYKRAMKLVGKCFKATNSGIVYEITRIDYRQFDGYFIIYCYNIEGEYIAGSSRRISPIHLKEFLDNKMGWLNSAEFYEQCEMVEE